MRERVGYINIFVNYKKLKATKKSNTYKNFQQCKNVIFYRFAQDALSYLLNDAQNSMIIVHYKGKKQGIVHYKNRRIQ